MCQDEYEKHEFDDDAICIKCGFDGAEWWHWKHNTYEGKASDMKEPRCILQIQPKGTGHLTSLPRKP